MKSEVALIARVVEERLAELRAESVATSSTCSLSRPDKAGEVGVVIVYTQVYTFTRASRSQPNEPLLSNSRLIQ